MKRITLKVCLVLFFFLFFTACSTGPEPAELPAEDEFESLFELPSPEEALPVSSFPEIWGYLLAGR
ncbi:MAG: hypothetical protein LBT93_05580, partial [Treponema sp.]|nr:hypothetical protein [Treponema sp.]